MKKTLLAVLALGFAGVSAHANTVINTQVGTPHQTPAMDTFQVTGDEMVGMEVWATFATPGGPVTRTTTWAALVAGTSGQAVDPGWFSITESGDTFGGMSSTGPWSLNNLSTFNITSFGFDGHPGDTTFDRSPPVPPEGTLGSDVGRDFDVFDNSVNSVLRPIEYDVTATYSDILNITGLPAVGDEWLKLRVDFGLNSPAGTPGSFYAPTGPNNPALTFQQDTDLAATRGSITEVPDVASTSLLLGLSAMGLAALRRRLS